MRRRIAAIVAAWAQCALCAGCLHIVPSPLDSSNNVWAALIPFLLSGPTTITFYVNASATGAGTGKSWADAFTTVQAGVDAAAAHLVEYPSVKPYVFVADGTYKPAAALGTVITMSAGVEVYGRFLGTEASIADRAGTLGNTILSGDFDNSGTATVGDSCNVVDGASNTVLDGFQITRGFGVNATNTACAGSNAYGGAISTVGNTNQTYTNLLLVANSATGGVIDQEGGTGKYFNLKFISNTPENSPGLRVHSAGSAIIVNSLFRLNSSSPALQGGALAADGSTIVATNCTFQGNTNGTAQSYFGSGGDCQGTVFAVQGSTIRLRNSVLHGNTVTPASYDVCSSWRNPPNDIPNIQIDIENSMYQTLDTVTTPGTQTANSVALASPYTIVGNDAFLNPAADTDGGGAGTSNLAVDAGSTTYADDPTYGYPAFGVDWRTLSTQSGGAKDTGTVDMGMHY